MARFQFGFTVTHHHLLRQLTMGFALIPALPLAVAYSTYLFRTIAGKAAPNHEE